MVREVELLRIKIVKTPNLEIQEDLAAELVGMKFTGRRIPENMPELSLVSLQERPNRGGVIVLRSAVIQILQSEKPKLANWLDRNIIPEIL